MNGTADKPAIQNDETARLTARTIDAVAEVDAAQWDACAGPGDPFLSHAFFRAAEASGSACTETGWMPQHLVIEDASGRLVGAMPLYLKGHSQGEFVFDHGWADAFERAGGRYYPKLLAGVPFTPVAGRRLLVAEGPRAGAIRDALIGTARELVGRYRVSSLHVIFPTEDDWRALGEEEFLLRTGVQFHWENEGYETFEDFLGTLASRKRKQIRRERREALNDGVSIESLTGDDIAERHWDAFFECYQQTSVGKWGIPYLTREFFSRIGETMAESVVLVMAQAGGRPIAGALNFKSRDRLYGRTWGCIEERRFLHFEACYYQAIDYAIAHRLKIVEAGVQGSHKLLRGYRPVPTYSAHWIAHAGLRDAVAGFLERETEQVDYEIEGLAHYTPFRKGDAAE